jgi:hypothetical protein
MSPGSPDGALSGRSRKTTKPFGRAWRIPFAVLLLLITGAATLPRAAPDAGYEAAAGIDKALKANPPTLTKDGDIEGKTFDVDDAFGQKGCKAKCEFVIAKSGTYPYAAANRLVKGVYVKISTTFDKNKCDPRRCEEVKVLQVYRDYTKNDKGGKETAEPDSKQRKDRAGWDDKASPSRGWGVDTADNAPFYGPGGADGSAENGSTDKPLIVRDAPGFFDGTTKKGTELIACAVCANKNEKSRIIGCVTFGFYIDADGKVAFEPRPPTLSGTAPQQVKDALGRFENIKGNTSANIQF